MAPLEEMTISELEVVAAKLRDQIRRNPGHSKMEEVELEDVNGWIVLRRNESQNNSEPTL
jgi:hypothetical protein